MLDVPEKINLTHDVKIPPIKVDIKLYDAEQKTLLGIPVSGLIATAAIIGIFFFINKKRKKVTGK